MKIHTFQSSMSNIVFILFLILETVTLVQAAEFVPREVIVSFAYPTGLAEAKTLLNGEYFDVRENIFPPLSIYMIKIVNLNMSENEAIDSLSKLSFITKVHLNYKYDPSLVPNDPDFVDQWNLSQASNHDINGPEAWDIASGSESLFGRNAVVAVIDVGFNRNHSELLDRQWINRAELNGTSGIDDDGNGVVDDIRGYRAYDDHEVILQLGLDREDKYLLYLGV